MKSNTMPNVRLRATISIEVEALRTISRAGPSTSAGSSFTFRRCRATIPEAWIAVTERRRGAPAAVAEGARPRDLRRCRTGKLHAYD